MSEHQDQVALFVWAKLQENSHPELKMLHAIPNGGARTAVTGSKLKAEGVKRGVPDLSLPVARGGHHGLYIELKIKRNKLTIEQSWWLSALRQQGYRAEMCVGWDQARDLIKEYLGFNKEGVL